MLKKEVIARIDAMFTKYNSKYLIRNESNVKDGTSYCNYHFRQALLGLSNDFTGKIKKQIQDKMYSKTKRENFNHISNLIKRLKESDLPIDVKVGAKIPFEVIYHDKSVLQDANIERIYQSEKKNAAGYVPGDSDVRQAMQELGIVNVSEDNLLGRIEENCKSRGVHLKEGWQKITRRIWSQ